MTGENPAPAWLGPLRWPAYRRVWTVFSLQQLGYWVGTVAFQWLVAAATGNDPLMLGLLYVCLQAPMLLVALPAGVLADTADRRRIVIATLAVGLVAATTASVLVHVDLAPLAALMACASAAGAGISAAQPASQALVADSVPPADLRGAIVLNSVALNLARIAGPALAGLVILAWGPANSLLVAALMGAVGALIMGQTTVRRRPPSPTRPGLFSGVGASLRHARQRPPAAVTLVIVAVTAVFGMSYVAQLPAFAARVSGDPATFVALTTVSGVGSLAGVALLAAVPLRRPSVTPTAALLAVLGVCLVGLGLTRTLWLQFVLVGVAGGLQFAVLTQSNTVLQQVVAEEFRGRVMSLFMLCWGGLMPVGSLLLGVGWRLLGPVPAVVTVGAVVIAVAAWVLARHRPAR